MENNMEESLSQDLPQALKGSKILTLSQAVWMDLCSWCVCLGSKRGASHEIPAQQWAVSNNKPYIKSAVLHHALWVSELSFLKQSFRKQAGFLIFFFFKEGIGGSGKVPKLSRDLWFLHSQVKCVLGKGEWSALYDRALGLHDAGLLHIEPTTAPSMVILVLEWQAPSLWLQSCPSRRAEAALPVQQVPFSSCYSSGVPLSWLCELPRVILDPDKSDLKYGEMTCTWVSQIST